jgi:hypothetical protein
MLRLATRLLLVVGSAAIGAAGAIALRADLLVGYGFGKAFEAQRAALPFELTLSPGGQLARAEVGDEGYWLTRAGVDSPALFDKPLAVGDRITIASRNGRSRTLDVVDLKAFIGSPLLKVAADAAPVHLVRVTARVGGAAGNREELVRFFIEVEEPKPAPPPEPQASLGRT